MINDQLYPNNIFRWELEPMEAILVPLRELPGVTVLDTNGFVPVVSGSPSVAPPVEHLQNIIAVNCKNWGKLFYFKCGAGNVYLVVLGGPLDAVHHLVGQPGKPIFIWMFLHGVTPGKYQNIAVGVDGYCRHNPVDIKVMEELTIKTVLTLYSCSVSPQYNPYITFCSERYY